VSRTPCANIRLSQPLNRLAIVTAVLILLTSSFDIFLVLEAGGNYRFCQIITPILVFLAIVKAARSKRIPVLGAVPLVLWFIFQVSFIPTTDFWPKSVGYCFWLLLNLSLVFSCVQLFSDNLGSLLTILRWYVYSFALVASFGIVQFLLPLLGLGGPLVKQWFIPQDLARANGFSYEPSYFASYLLIGFVLVGSLRRNRSSLLPSRTLLAVYWLTALGIVLSSSRMGIFFLFVDVFLSQFSLFLSFFADLLRLRIAVFKVRALIPSFLSIAFICTTAAGASVAIQKNPALALMLLNGTGISDTAAHSVIQREDSLEETLTVFLEHPLIGRSLGGVSSAIAELRGERVQSFADSKDFEGMNVFAEALAAGGVIGIIPFVCFVLVMFQRPWRLARIAPPFYSVLLGALLRSLLFAWVILQFNQNMLRPYLWTHLAILATVYAAALQLVNMRTGLRTSSE
jgi:hypothetical protein